MNENAVNHFFYLFTCCLIVYIYRRCQALIVRKERLYILVESHINSWGQILMLHGYKRMFSIRYRSAFQFRGRNGKRNFYLVEPILLTTIVIIHLANWRNHSAFSWVESYFLSLKQFHNKWLLFEFNYCVRSSLEIGNQK